MPHLVGRGHEDPCGGDGGADQFNGVETSPFPAKGSDLAVDDADPGCGQQLSFVAGECGSVGDEREVFGPPLQ